MVDMDDRIEGLEDSITDRVKRIGRGKYSRILKMAKKPTRDEFGRSSLITGIGIIIIGGLGFIIYLLMNVLFKVP
ncbi:MAG: protein translocase SEC61 complex subunit gamma [Thermoplasmatales archaeon]|jgi:protein transport protein SEC61 subunit gamma-like protein|nr:protein translocase SEC61 complex subunit gamma [Candidatus Thermoplasmatota archaeon]MCL6002780.1 protein translocase SEC61 complex subunit gamma [Candidatus Thermoplasmatota archaeon]MDA8056145.1 protein translocase SEC61 complex subunit gamma [Thermoplasmatales archaeon]